MEFLCWFIRSKMGLVLNFVGTLLIAISFGRNLEDAHQVDDKGRKVHLASLLRPRAFRFGIILVILGFLLQLIFSNS
jgi:hypothetical protein